MNPPAHPARPVPVGKTREEVRAELVEAKRVADHPILENGQTPKQLNPSAHPVRSTAEGKTRAAVTSELAKAIRLGEFPLTESGITPREMGPHRCTAS
jgi:hypothetical protein